MKKTPRKIHALYWQLTLGMVGGLWLFGNVVASQFIPALYFKLTGSGQINSVGSYLRTIRYSPLFLSEITKYRHLYGSVIDDYVFANERQQQVLIKKYETALSKNPQSVTALYNLSLLYKENNNKQKSEYYLQMAKELDPSL